MLDRLLYGVAYYLEYMPEDRLEQDMRMLKDAGFNLIRVAESTWSTWEPREGKFDFTMLHRVLGAAQRHGISVIVGTPTYAIPPWLAHKYPDVLSDTHHGPCRYGPRQNFDLTHPGYRYHAERIIRKLMEAVQGYSCVVGFQLDNETKPYDTCSPRAQALFAEWLKERFESVEALNARMGLAYWSNSLGCWDDLPDVRGTINASLGGEYQAFQRWLVTDFLRWQRAIVDEYRRADQFVTHNFDYEWRDASFGQQPEVDQFEAAQALTASGCDIYHLTQDELTGEVIAFCGAFARNLKEDRNYLVLETQAQGNLRWLPYPGQLRLQAFSHLANGADCVEYWHWHSIHNAIESYWKGVLSHDLAPNAVYREAATIGRDFARLSPHLVGLQKRCRVAVMASWRSQTGLRWFPTDRSAGSDRSYSDYMRWLCDAFYRLNVEYDIIPDTARDFSAYDLLVLPCLYSAADELLCAVDRYVAQGGHLIATFKTGFCDEFLKVRHDAQPHGLTACLGLRYDRYTAPRNVRLTSDCIALGRDAAVSDWMELLEVTTAQVLFAYDHPAWGGIPAVTINDYGAGQAVYLGCYFDAGALRALLSELLPRFGLPLSPLRFPVIVREGVNRLGRAMRYYFNYSGEQQAVTCAHPAGVSLLDERSLSSDEAFMLPPWGMLILESEE